MLKIGQLAKIVGVNIDTIRYYERRGLIPEPSRQASGYREYSQEYVLRIRFVKRAQELGFSLREIEELFELRIDSQTVCNDVKRRTEAKVIHIDKKIQSLQRMKKTLVDLLTHCESQKLTDECPILRMLESDNDDNRLVVEM